jgi:hypothetical protein
VAAHVVEEDFDLLMIYYSGHGNEEEGAWKVAYLQETLEMEPYSVYLKDILKVIKYSGFKKDLVITSDSCYSGRFAYKAKELWESGEA